MRLETGAVVTLVDKHAFFESFDRGEGTEQEEVFDIDTGPSETQDPCFDRHLAVELRWQVTRCGSGNDTVTRNSPVFRR